MSSIADSWARIDEWYAENVPSRKWYRTRGASDAQIVATEAKLGIELPSAMKESYRQRNGTADCWLLHYEELLSIGDVPGQWAMFSSDSDHWTDFVPTEIEGPIKPIWWSPNRIPVTADGGGDTIQVDLDPDVGGHHGQVIYWSHEVGPARVLAPDFAAWIERIADDLEAGRYTYYPDDDTVAPVGMY